MLYHNKPLDSKDARSYADELVESIEVLEDHVRELEDQIEEMKKQSADEQTEAEEKGYNDGYAQGCKDKEEECEKKWKPKFQFR
jgi:flagellar biosynthesis/type III secretory pathway protein FliH